MLPFIITPATHNSDALAWVRRSRSDIDGLLLEHGAVLIRGLPLNHWSRVETVGKLLVGESMNYRERATPRQPIHGDLATSTIASPRYEIGMHSESTYASEFPGRLFFYCHQCASQGGRTPLADIRRVYQRLNDSIRSRFEVTGVTYQRTFGLGPGMGYREALQVDTPEQACSYAQHADCEIEWLGEDIIRLVQTRPATLRHPITREAGWFNHVNVFHKERTPEPIRQMIRQQHGDDILIQHSYYGDGSEIEPDVLDHVKDCYTSEQALFDWQAGDCLILDNLLIAHGREPYKGERQIGCLLGSKTSWRDITTPPSHS